MAAGGNGTSDSSAKKHRAQRFRPPHPDQRLSAGEDRFARTLAMRAAAGEDTPGEGAFAPAEVEAAYRAAWPGRARRFRAETVAGKAAALVDTEVIRAAIAHYREQRKGAPQRLDWARARRAQDARQRRQRLGIGVREVDSPVDRGTDQTRAKLRTDVIRKLHDGGHLRDEHVAAAEEISRLVLAFMRGLFPTSRALDGTRGAGAKGGARRYLDPADRLSLWEARQWSQVYAPWSREMGDAWVSCRRGRLNRLGLVWAVVLDNVGPRQLEQIHGMRHGTARKILAEALWRYAEISGIYRGRGRTSPVPVDVQRLKDGE